MHERDPLYLSHMLDTARESLPKGWNASFKTKIFVLLSPIESR